MAHEVTTLLPAVAAGDPRAIDDVLSRVYDALRAKAKAFLQHERPDHALQATDLVHEVYLKLVDQRQATWHDRGHFLALAAQAMRRILIDQARSRGRAKRGGGRDIAVDLANIVDRRCGADLLELDEAMTRLEAIRPTAARIVEFRCFGGMSLQETALVLGVSESTVQREWRYARAWLRTALGSDRDPAEAGP